ncbi:MAG: hypothetical protein M0Q91_13575 [Methanoregula sp.]|jgi:hypothetical protein|nr:hypothetical protein [Methanoregula sp.]
MNVKFFGDSKDLFKYDLITDILKNFHGKIDRLVIVPMLTSYYPRFRGNTGCRNKNLIECFRRFRTKEDVDNYYTTLRQYFKDLKESIGIKKVRVRIEKDETFSQQTRSVYFSGIFEHFPQACLLFIDPDTGVKENNYTAKHLSFAELKEFWDRLDNESVLMIYQHFQRNQVLGSSDPHSKAAAISRFIGISPLIIADTAVMFIFLIKNPELRSELKEILKNYEKRTHDSIKDPKKRRVLIIVG